MESIDAEIVRRILEHLKISNYDKEPRDSLRDIVADALERRGLK